MVDFNKILTPGDVDNGTVNVVIEIPTGSNNKIEWNREKACFQLDRVEPMIFAKPILNTPNIGGIVAVSIRFNVIAIALSKARYVNLFVLLFIG